MDSETSSNLILVAIIAAAILVPLVLIGVLVLILLPVVRRRRRQWQAAAASLGLQSDPMSMFGTRGLPVRVFWRIEGANAGRLDMGGVVLAGRNDMRGGRAGLRYVYCQALLEPPLRLGLSLGPFVSGASAAASISTGHPGFDSAFRLDAAERSGAQKLFSSIANELAAVAQGGWKISATDEYVQIRLGGDYFSQFPERDPALLTAAVDTSVYCGRCLLDAQRKLSPATSNARSG